jgi:hypothetical protein
MLRTTALIFLSLAFLGVTAGANAQGRWNRHDRNEVARLQGVPPGQLPPADLCRVFYDGRPYGRQSGAMNCRQAESIAARDRYARVIYGEDAYAYRDRYSYPGTWGRGDDWRTGRNRDPRLNDGIYDRARTPAYETGFGDGLQRGREDVSRRNSYDLNRHGWYRSADRGYENRDGSRLDYRRWYREGFEAGYSQAYRGYVR